MEVNIFGEGAVGYKNIVKSSSSQDFFLYKKYKNYAVCTVADGHSMDVFKYSHIGSYLACQSVFEILKTYKLNEDIEKGEQNFICDLKNKKVQNDIKNKWRDLVYREFYKRNYKVYKLDYMLFGTTLSFVIFLKEYIVFFNLGDSSILIKEDKDYVNVFKNNNFKFVNSLALYNCEEKMQYSILKMNKDFKLVISTDGFINSFETYQKLKSELDRTFQILEKDIFSNRYLRNIYKKHLSNISKYGSKDDISIIYIYN